MGLARILSFIFYGPAWLTFLFMGAAAGGFALCTYDLFHIFSANFAFISTYGLMAIFDGGLLQLLQLLFWGYGGIACYVVFKGCLDGLTHRVPTRPHPPQDAPSAAKAAPRLSEQGKS